MWHGTAFGHTGVEGKLFFAHGVQIFLWPCEICAEIVIPAYSSIFEPVLTRPSMHVQWENACLIPR